MNNLYPLLLWPAAASASAVSTDHLIIAFTILTVLLVVPIFVGITWFAIRFRDGKHVNRLHTATRDRALELGWMIIPFVLTLIFFAWGTRIFVEHKNPPPNATRIAAIGRQWMWKFQHPGGQSEINDLHVPTGEPILIDMISQDVIHSLYIPALRIQMETLPGRYTQLWFNADRVGAYHILCSEFCGTDHSVMAGTLYVMTPADFADWLAHTNSGLNVADQGRQLFVSYGCGGCHEGASTVRAPTLAGLFGRPVPLEAGGTAIADAAFIRGKILAPDENKLAGYKQEMPSYKGLLSEEDLTRLVAYIRTDPPKPQASR